MSFDSDNEAYKFHDDGQQGHHLVYHLGVLSELLEHLRLHVPLPFACTRLRIGCLVAFHIVGHVLQSLRSHHFFHLVQLLLIHIDVLLLEYFEHDAGVSVLNCLEDGLHLVLVHILEHVHALLQLLCREVRYFLQATLLLASFGLFSSFFLHLLYFRSFHFSSLFLFRSFLLSRLESML